jgi:adenylosuccinate synthase
MKAYTTRVGEGPFPSESAELSDLLHGMGREYGSTTGRARRCGWFDAVATRYATMINGIDEIAVTNLDGLDGLKTIKVCVAYKVGKKTLEVPPSDLAGLQRATPVYIELPGWQQSTEHVKSFNDLPPRARTYLKRLCSLSGARLALASVGPDRDQTMVVS